MISALREKTQGLIGALVLIVVTVPFILWGVSSYFNGQSVSYVAKGHGIRITRMAYEQALQQKRALFERLYGSELNPQVLHTQRFKKAILNNLIEKTLLLNDAKQAGYSADPLQVTEAIHSIPALYVKGAFSPARYQEFLQNENMTPAQFRQRVGDILLIDTVKVGILASAFVPKPLIDHAVSLMAERRAVSYTLIAPQAYRRDVHITPAEIRQYYAKHRSQFHSPQQVRVAYVLLSPQAIMRHMSHKFATSTLRQAYENNAALFTTPEQRLVAHIFISVPAKAPASAVAAADAKLKAIRARILHGASFAAMARRYSQDRGTADSGGRLGYVTTGDLSPAVAKSAFALRVGAVSKPIRGKSGVHLVKVLAVRPAKRASFSSVRAELVQIVLKRRANRRLYRLDERLRNEAFEHPSGLKKVARAVGLNIHQSGWFTRAGGTGVAGLKKVVKAVFAPKTLAGKRNTHAIPVGKNSLVVVHVIGHKPSQAKPLDEVRGEIVAQLRTQDELVEAKKAAGRVVDAVASGLSLQKAAGGLRVTSAEVAPSETQGSTLPPDLQKAILSVPVSKKLKGHTVMLGDGRVGVFVIRKITFGHAGHHEKLVAQVTKSLKDVLGVGAYAAYAQSVRKNAHVHINLGQL